MARSCQHWKSKITRKLNIKFIHVKDSRELKWLSIKTQDIWISFLKTRWKIWIWKCFDHCLSPKVGQLNCGSQQNKTAIFLNYQLYLWPRATSNLHEIIIRCLIPSKLEHLSVVLIKNGTRKTRVEWRFSGNLRDI